MQRKRPFAGKRSLNETRTSFDESVDELLKSPVSLSPPVPVDPFAMLRNRSKGKMATKTPSSPRRRVAMTAREKDETNDPKRRAFEIKHEIRVQMALKQQEKLWKSTERFLNWKESKTVQVSPQRLARTKDVDKGVLEHVIGERSKYLVAHARSDNRLPTVRDSLGGIRSLPREISTMNRQRSSAVFYWG